VPGKLEALQKRVAEARETLDRVAPVYNRAVDDLANAEWSLWSAKREAEPSCPYCGRKEHTGCLCPK